MEFGALQCTPKNPRCDQCPMAFACYAFVKNAQNELPVKLKKTKKTNRFFHYLAFKNKDGYLLKERKNNDIWKGLYEFPLIEEKELLEIGELLENHFGKDAKSVFVKLESPEYKHILSHQNIKAKFWVIESTEIAEKLIKMGRLRFYNAQEVQDLPKHVLINKFLEEFIF
jgi:A/G-specific adenine glycosylase